MYSFGSGVLIGTRTDIANATPVNFGLVQEVTIEETATVKETYWPVPASRRNCRGTIKTTGKAKVARISGIAFGNLYYGVTPVAGQIATSFAEAQRPFRRRRLRSRSPMLRPIWKMLVSSMHDWVTINTRPVVPVAGQYSVNTSTGVYTFSSADNVAGVKVLISYTYGITSAGQKIAIANQLLGTTPTFKAKFYTTFQGQAISCSSTTVRRTS